jgi:Rrf2 family cysteine metabolism transcriptional repressor
VWINRRTDYAARAVLALAIDGGRLTLDVLALRTGTPVSVLEQVMPRLRSAGIVRSTRGRDGGYELNNDPAEVTLEDVVRLFQGPLAPIGCATRKNPEPCEVRDGCAMHDVWAEVRDATIRTLEVTSFAVLAERSAGVWRAHEDGVDDVGSAVLPT